MPFRNIAGILFCILGLQLQVTFCFNSFIPSRIVGSFGKSEPLLAGNLITTDAEPQTISNSIMGKFSKFNSFAAIGIVLASSVTKTRVNAATEQAYLREPTVDFKEEEKKVAAFQSLQKQIRIKWDAIIDRLQASEEPAETESIIREMIAYLQGIQSIPQGVKKLEIVKLCRKKKFLGKKINPKWTKEVEIAYEAFIQEFNRQVLPNNKSESRI
mmetsp:Transcript_501/g.844  ORF Transcript_501/g.844 Transcript_501/m.844 type:complete len:214 (+) Transcript_501:21-662(+)